jgi:hypothetical protein
MAEGEQVWGRAYVTGEERKIGPRVEGIEGFCCQTEKRLGPRSDAGTMLCLFERSSPGRRRAVWRYAPAAQSEESPIPYAARRRWRMSR